MRLLLVEDDVAYAAVIQGYLKRLAPDIDTSHVTLLAAGLSKVATEAFDICLLDLNLPDSQGVATVAALSAASPSLPLVVLTGEVESDLDRQVIQAGAQDYLAKSEVGVASLRHAIRHAIERQRLTNSLARAHRLNRHILDSLPASIELLDADGRVELINLAGLASLGEADPAQIQGKDWLQLWMPPAAATLAPLLNRARAGEVATGQALLARQRKPLRWWDIKVVPLQQDDLSPERFLVVALDATERQQQEAHVRLAQRAELLGHIAGGVVHNFNNLLTVVQGYSEMMLRTLPETEARQRRRAQDIRQAAIRGRDLVERLLTYAYPSASHPKLVDLNSLIGQERSFLEKVLSPLSGLHLALSEHPPQVSVDPVVLLQVIMTFLLNANDAMPDGGSVTICTDLIDLDANTAQKLLTMGRISGDVTSWLPHLPARFGVLSVRDTGVGMDDETLANIFTPFFTTKPVDKGAGLGLATVAASIMAMGGFIWVESQLGKGSRFDVYLPVQSVDSEVNRTSDTAQD